MLAAILSIGDELIAGEIVDRNARWLADRLAERTVTTIQMRVVPDDRDAIALAVGQLCEQADVVLLTGGLGPTADDLTRAALGDALTPGTELVTDPEALSHLERCFKGRAGRMPRSNLAQALRPEGTCCIPNPHGTALGIAGRLGGCLVFALPGPPPELHPMFTDHVAPKLADSPQRPVRLTATVHAYGLGESVADELLGSDLHRRRPRVGITTSASIVTARVRCDGPQPQAAAELEALVEKVVDRWTPWAFGRDDQTLEQCVAALLDRSGRTLATAESCTGGLLGSMIVATSGASRHYLGGWVTYTDALKTSQLGVPESLLRAHGAVSEQVAAAMAVGALQRSGADESLAVTGIAGPEGGSPDKPVGTVYIAHGRAGDSPRTSCRRFRFPGDRSTVRDRAAKSALQMLRLALLDRAGTPMLWGAA